MSVVKRKMYSYKEKTLSRYKRIQQFLPESIEQNPPVGCPQIRFRIEIQTNKKEIYLSCDILSSLLKSSVEKFCCPYLEAETAILFLYSRTKEYDQTTVVMTDSEDTDVVVMCAYATSTVNDELQCKRPLLKRNV